MPNNQPLGPMINLNVGSPKLSPSQEKLATWELTPKGKMKVDDYAFTGPRWEVLSELGTRGPSSVRELDESIKLGGSRLLKILNNCKQEGLVMKKMGDN